MNTMINEYGYPTEKFMSTYKKNYGHIFKALNDFNQTGRKIKENYFRCDGELLLPRDLKQYAGRKNITWSKVVAAVKNSRLLGSKSRGYSVNYAEISLSLLGKRSS